MSISIASASTERLLSGQRPACAASCNSPTATGDSFKAFLSTVLSEALWPFPCRSWRLLAAASRATISAPDRSGLSPMRNSAEPSRSRASRNGADSA